MCGIFLQSSNTIQNVNKFINTMKNIDNRGRECFGVAYNNDNNNLDIKHYKYRITKYSNNENQNKKIASRNIIGHVRYSTTNNKTIASNNIQPIFNIRNNKQKYALIHNGNIPFIEYDDGRSDTYKLIEYINKHPEKDLKIVLENMLNDIACAYCIGILDENGYMYVCKDNFGIRPLYINFTNTSIKIASETSCFELNNNNNIIGNYREIQNGEILVINNGKLLYTNYNNDKKLASNICCFEYIYFFSDNHIDTKTNKTLYDIRYEFGIELAKIEKIKHKSNQNIIVIGIPNTGISTGKAFAKELNYTYKQAINKTKDCGRSFILPTNEARNKLLNEKLQYNKDDINGNIVYIIDDSIVRGTTMKNIIARLKEYGASEIHIRISSPPVISTCYYGVDMASHNELMAYNKSLDEIKNWLDCNSITYINIETIKKVLARNNMCTGCFDGKYPTNLINDW